MPDPTPNLVDIAASLRRHSPGAVPVLGEEDGRLCMIESSGRGEYAANWHVPLPDDIASHVLIAAIVLALPFLVRDERNGAMCWGIDDPKDGVRTWFADSDHNNDPLLSLYEAWKFAKGIA